MHGVVMRRIGLLILGLSTLLMGCQTEPSISIRSIYHTPQLAPLSKSAEVVIYVPEGVCEDEEFPGPVVRGVEPPRDTRVLVITIVDEPAIDFPSAFLEARRIARHNGCNGLLVLRDVETHEDGDLKCLSLVALNLEH